MAKKSKSKNLPLFTIAGIIILLIFAFLLFRTVKPAPVIAPIETPAPSVTQSLNGIYKGNLPCADCPGITETLILANDNSYILEDVYQEKSTKPFQSQGTWEITSNNILKLTPKDKTEQTQYFQISGTTLEPLDSNMQKIDSPFNQSLTKQY